MKNKVQMKIIIISVMILVVVGGFFLVKSCSKTKSVSGKNVKEEVTTQLEKEKVEPTLEINGDRVIMLSKNDAYEEPGAIATNEYGEDVSDKVMVESDLDTSKSGTYEITYTYECEDGEVISDNRRVIVKVQSTKELPDKVIYLTFDDGPGKYTERLLDILDEYDVKATFFVINNDYKDLIKKEYDAGHTVAIHSYCHEYDRIYSSPEAYWEDCYEMQDVIYDETGVRTNYFRFPGGSSNRVGNKHCQGIMDDLIEQADEKGMSYYDWNVDSGDGGGKLDSATIIENVTSTMKNHSVVLMHDIKESTVDSVESIIQWGIENDYVFLPLDDETPTVHHR